MIVRVFITFLILILSTPYNSYAENKDKEFNNDAAVKTSATKTSATDAKPLTPNTSNTTKTWNYGSLMLDSKTLEWVNEAIKSHDQKIPLEILLPALFPSSLQATPEENTTDLSKPDNSSLDILTDIIKKTEAPKDAPIFYLKSILYFSSNNWSIWLNDKKISDKNSDTNVIQNISIMKTSPNEVIMLWKKTQIDLIYPNWRSNFTPIDDNKFASPARNIIIDSTTGDISFILRPNQSLLSKSLEIIEGKLPSTPSSNVATTLDDDAKTQTTQHTTVINKPSAKSSENYLESFKNIDILKSILNHNKELDNINIDKPR